jgi:hypothetical protein
MAEATLMEKVNKLGVGVQPTTAVGAASIGGTPQQQAMAGSGAAKKKVLKEQTLGGQERLAEGAPVQATTGQSEAAAKAEKIASIGGSSAARIESAINKQINTFATPTLAVQADETALSSAMGLTADQLKAQKADPKSKYNLAAKAVTDFAAAPDEAKRNAALTSLTTLGVPAASATTLLQTAQQAITGAVTQEMAAPVTMSTVDLKGLVPGIDNLTQLATALGMPEADLAKVNVSEFPAIIQDIQQKELAQADALRAQIASLPPESQQAQLLTKQLQQVEQVGLGAAEENVEQSIAKLNTADEFKIGDESFTAEDLLGSEELTPVITDWLNAKTPEEREKIIPTTQYAGLVDWLTKNEKSLSALAQTAVEGTKKAEETTANVAAVTATTSPEIVKAVTGQDLAKPGTTQADVDKAKKAMDATGIGQLANEGDLVTVELVNKLPEKEKAAALKMSKDDLKAAAESAQWLEADPDLVELAGITASNGMVLDSKQREKLKTYKDAVDLVKKDETTADWLNQDFFKKLKPEEMKTLVKWPHRYRELESYYKDYRNYKALSNANLKDTATADKLLDLAVGTDVDQKDIENKYAAAVKWAAQGDKDALATKKSLEDAFGLSTDSPLINADKLRSIRIKMQDSFASAPNTIINGKKPYRDQGIDVISDIKKVLDTGVYKPVEGSVYSLFNKELDDGKLDKKEIEAAIVSNEDDLLKLIKAMPDNESTLKVFNQVKKDYQVGQFNKGSNQVLTAAGLGNLSDLLGGVMDMSGNPSDKSMVGRLLKDMKATSPSLSEAGLKDLKKAKDTLIQYRTDHPEMKEYVTEVLGQLNDAKVAAEAEVKQRKKLHQAAVDLEKNWGGRPRQFRVNLADYFYRDTIPPIEQQDPEFARMLKNFKKEGINNPKAVQVESKKKKEEPKKAVTPLAKNVPDKASTPTVDNFDFSKGFGNMFNGGLF